MSEFEDGRIWRRRFYGLLILDGLLVLALVAVAVWGNLSGEDDMAKDPAMATKNDLARQLCDRAVTTLLTTKDPLELSRADATVRGVPCDVIRRMTPALAAPQNQSAMR